MNKLDQPLVSIIVVSYNHSKYIVENLNSVKNQTYKNIELIVVDDYSKDNSVEVYERWLKENNHTAIKKFNTYNKGLATTLNECLILIRGKYVKLIAADDFLHHESIQKSVDKLEELGENYGMIFSDTWSVDNNSQAITYNNNYLKNNTVNKEYLREQLIFANFIPGLTVLMRTKALIKTGKFNPDIITEDYHRWLKISELYWMYYMPVKLAYYRIHPQNISNLKKNLVIENDIRLKMEFDKNGAVRTQINKYLIRSYFKIYNNKNLIYQYDKYDFKNKLLSLFLKSSFLVSIFYTKFFNRNLKITLVVVFIVVNIFFNPS